MHDSVYNALVDWWELHRERIGPLPVAEVGSRILNGLVRRGLGGANVTGFDVVAGPGVDVVLEHSLPSPVIPLDFRHKFEAVVSVSSFQFCPDSELYKGELVDLIKPGGLLFLTMCRSHCKHTHTTSPNPWGWTDEFRLEPAELVALLAPEFTTHQIRLTSHDIIYEGSRTNPPV